MAELSERDQASVEIAERAGVQFKVTDGSGKSVDLGQQVGSSQEQTTQDNQSSSAEGDQGPQRPEWCPEKFWDAEKGEVKAEELAKANSELERQFTQSRQQKPTQQQQPEGQQQETTDGSQVADPQVLVDSATNEFIENGGLSEDTYSNLEKAGYPRSLVDNYIQGQVASAAKIEADAHTLVGGKEVYEAMQTWAAENLSQQEQAAFNAAIEDPAGVEFAVKSLHARYKAESDVEPTNEVRGTGKGAPVEPPFENQAEYIAAMSKTEEQAMPSGVVKRVRLYDVDEDYRNSVARRLAKSRHDLI